MEKFDPRIYYTINQYGESETIQQMMDRLAREATCKHGVNYHVMSCGMCIGENYQLVKEFTDNLCKK